MKPYSTRSWESVRDSFDTAPEMRGLVERIAARFDGLLFPVTSMDTLRLFPHSEWTFVDDCIEIEHRDDIFTVRYSAVAPRNSGTVRPKDSSWSKQSADGLDALERCLQHLRWIVRDREPS